jgi:hypothetical protein
MIDGYSFLGLQEITGVNATVDNSETGRINPQVWAIEALRYDSMHIPIARSNGITAAIVAPAGGLISGRSVLIKLDGWTNREMVVKNPAARGAPGALRLGPLLREEEALCAKDPRRCFAGLRRDIGIPAPRPPG